MVVQHTENTTVKTRAIVNLLGDDLLDRLSGIKSNLPGSVYLSGGTVRDILLGRTPRDIDLTVVCNAKGWAAKLVELTGATPVALGREEDAIRVVWRGRDIDFTSFREGAESVEQELTKRDITINSMAVCIDDLLEKRDNVDEELIVVDPVGGGADLAKQTVRLISARSIKSDPLRMLRVFRFCSTLDFTIDKDSFAWIAKHKDLIVKPAAERIAYELELIMGSSRGYAAICDLARSGLLFVILPELKAGKGMEQPASHHLDVFEHSLATLQNMEKIQSSTVSYFPEQSELMSEYVGEGRNRVRLKWAALLHDLGKPGTVTIDEDRGGRITFYNHDQEGAKLVESIGRRLKWSGADIRSIANMVGWHMRPFHLCNVQRSEDVSLKACLRLVRTVGSDLPGLFLLAMADSLAGKGEERPGSLEREVAELCDRLIEVQHEHVEPVRSGPPLLTGKDLVNELNLEPGPLFKRILNDVEEAQMEKLLSSREEALEFVRSYLEREKDQK